MTRACLLWLALWHLAACAPREPQPIPVQVHLVGAVRIYQPPGEQPEPCYLTGHVPALRVDPARPEEGQCDPFEGGRLELSLRSPAGNTVVLAPIDLPGAMEARDNGYLLRALPVTEAEKAALDEVGRWRLELTWRCAAEARRTAREEITFRRHPHFERQEAMAGYFAREKEASEMPVVERIRREHGMLLASDPPEVRLWTLKRLVERWYAAGDYARAEATALEMAAAAEAAGFPSEAVLGLTRAHEMARDQDLLQKAEGYLDRAQARLDQIDWVTQEPATLYTRAVLLDRLGTPQEALEASQAARRGAYRLGNTRIEYAARELERDLNLMLGHRARVDAEIEEALQQPNMGPAALNNLGWLILRVLAGRDLPDDRAMALMIRAEQLLQQAAAGFHALNNRPDEAHVMAELAYASILRRDAAGARSRLALALAYAGDLEAGVMHFMERVEGELELLEGRLPEALERFRRMERTASADETGRLLEYAGLAAFGQGEALRAMGRLAEATEAYDRALRTIDEYHPSRSPVHRASLYASRSGWEARAIQTRLDQGRREDALVVAEQGAWRRRQWRNPTDRRREGGIERDQEARLQEITRKIQALQIMTAGRDRDLRLEELEYERQRVWTDLDQRREPRPPAGPPAPDLVGLRQRLGKGDLLLRYAALPDELIVWEVSSQGIEVRRENLQQATLAGSVAQFSAGCTVGRSWVRSEELSRLLLGRYYQDPPDRLFLIVDGPLRELPWAAIPTGEGFLAEASILRLVPGLLMPPAGEAARGAPLIVANPTRDLPVASLEGRDLARLLPGAELLEHDAATRTRVLEKLSTCSLFHYAGHGRRDAHLPYLSHLRLARDETLSLIDIHGLRLAGSKVILNACEAATPDRDSRGALSLADGFLGAGARAVIAPMREIPDREGRRFAQALYVLLTSAGPALELDEALTRAQRTLIRGDSGEGGWVWSAYLALGRAP